MKVPTDNVENESHKSNSKRKNRLSEFSIGGSSAWTAASSNTGISKEIGQSTRLDAKSKNKENHMFEMATHGKTSLKKTKEIRVLPVP